MFVTIKDKSSVHDIYTAIATEIAGSRFTADITHVGATRLKIANVRLRESKEYCGNHPNACEVTVVGRKNRKAKYLEGTDWVEFNDRINDVLDGLNVDARVYTSVCEIRDGRLRRINYDSHILDYTYRPIWEWDKVGLACDYEDWCGRKAPASTYPYGTPGSYERD